MDGDTFEKLSNAFDTSFSGSNEILEIENEISIIENKKRELLDRISDKSTDMIKDQQFLDFELKTLITESRNVLHKLDADIKIGSTPRHYEVYAALVKAVLDQYKELREMNVIIREMEKQERDFQLGLIDSSSNNKNNKLKIEMDSNQLLDFIDNVRKNNSLNKIDVDFKIENNKEDEHE